jgi:protein TonB
MRNPTLHALNIGTLALWLSVAGFGAVAVWVPGFTHEIATSNDAPNTLYAEDFSLGDAGESQPGEAPPDTPAEPAQDTAEPLPAPPELPALAEIDPLPEIPDLPAPDTRSAESSSQPKPTARPALVGRPAPTNAGKTAGTEKSGAPGKTSGGGKPAAGSGMSVAARLAAGRMPKPSYPPYSRRNHQTGTAVVQFTIGTDGQVIAASIYKSSNWPLLDSEALRTVRTWRFPPGEIMANIKPIAFTLE